MKGGDYEMELLKSDEVGTSGRMKKLSWVSMMLYTSFFVNRYTKHARRCVTYEYTE